jgi:hypothetical protein
VEISEKDRFHSEIFWNKYNLAMYEYSLNILDFWPSTVIDVIFQHLSGKEVLEATTVHRSWNSFLSENSLTCWKDISVQPRISDDLHFLVNSKRRFQHLRAVNVTPIVQEFLEIAIRPERKWKTISIFRTNFKNETQLLKIMKAAAKTIERLELHTVTAPAKETESESIEKLTFPELKHLRISYHFLDELPALNSFFKATPKLESLHLTNGCDSKMKNIILTSAKLKNLSFSGRFQDTNFFRDLSLHLPSRLEEFEFNDILSSSNSDENLSYFCAFFKSQSKTLKKFETDALLELDEFEAAFNMTQLKTLNIKSFHYNMDIIDVYMEDLRRSTEISPATLKYFNVQLMDQNLLELLAINARNLEQMRADEMTATNASNPSWFPKLEKVQVFFLNQQLEEEITAKVEVERTRLERLIISGIVHLDIAIHLSQEEIAREIIDAIEG